MNSEARRWWNALSNPTSGTLGFASFHGPPSTDRKEDNRPLPQSRHRWADEDHFDGRVPNPRVQHSGFPSENAGRYPNLGEWVCCHRIAENRSLLCSLVVLLMGQRISNQETHHCSVRTYYSRPALVR